MPGKGTLLEMTKDFDVIVETDLNPSGPGEGVLCPALQVIR